MTSGMNFWDSSIWSFIITLTVLLSAILLANLIRRRVRFIQDSLIPSAVLGGFIVLLFNSIFKAWFGHPMLDLQILETLTYHCLGLGFIALAWRHIDPVDGKKAKRDVFNTATITVGTYLLQAVVGLSITIALFYLIGSFAASGSLLCMGYGQGPGQSFNWGMIFENQYGFTNGISFGLAIAATGFISACIGGVAYMKNIRKSYKTKRRLVRARRSEIDGSEPIAQKGEIAASESMDKLTVQFGLVFLTYIIAFASMWLTYKYLLLPAGGFCMNTINPLIWGFNFLIGTAWAVLLRKIGDVLRDKKIMHRKYTNNYMLNRISGLMFDIMVVSSIAAIDLSAFRVRSFWIPLLLLAGCGAIVTYIYVKRTCRKLFPGYSDEMFLAMYGMLTGTASTGIILLREVDPLFETPASSNIIYQNLWAILLGAPIMLLMGIVAKGILFTSIVLAAAAVLFAVILFVQHRRQKQVQLDEA
ncbi:MAG: hypothetical protein MJ146_02205 [Clostridia bacterium]|nr:hypothetical protein [Clostridia bacterium]